MDFTKSFNYMFEDSDWLRKTFIGGLWNIAALLFIGMIFVMGFLFELMSNVINGEDKPLPGWSNLGRKFAWGLMLSVICTVYFIPTIIISVILEDSYTDTAPIVLLLYMATVFWIPMTTVNFARTGDFLSAFRINEILNMISNNLGQYVTVVLLSFIVNVIMFFLGSLAFGIGIPFFVFWSMMVSAHLFGQLGRAIATPSEGGEEVNV